jgi:hypothetical protein
MTWALVTSLAQGSSDGAGFTTSAIDTTGANLIVVNVSDNDGTSTLADSKSNTWTLAAGPTTVQSCSRLYFCAATPTVGTGHTFTSGAQYASLYILAYSGAASSPLDQHAFASQAVAGTINPGSITPTENDELVISGMSDQDGSNPSAIDGGFTIDLRTHIAGGAHFGGGIAHLVQTTAAATNPQWSSASFYTGATIASFKGGAAAPPATPRLRGVTRSTQILQ